MSKVLEGKSRQSQNDLPWPIQTRQCKTLLFNWANLKGTTTAGLSLGSWWSPEHEGRRRLPWQQEASPRFPFLLSNPVVYEDGLNWGRSLREGAVVSGALDLNSFVPSTDAHQVNFNWSCQKFRIQARHGAFPFVSPWHTEATVWQGVRDVAGLSDPVRPLGGGQKIRWESSGP